MILAGEDFAPFANDIYRLGLEGRVIVVERVHDIEDYLQAADLGLITSEIESFCLSILEAMCFACPSVATKVGGIPEVIENDATGILVPFGDTAALARAVEGLIKEPARRAALGPRRRVVPGISFLPASSCRVTKRSTAASASERGWLAFWGSGQDSTGGASACTWTLGPHEPAGGHDAEKSCRRGLGKLRQRVDRPAAKGRQSSSEFSHASHRSVGIPRTTRASRDKKRRKFHAAIRLVDEVILVVGTAAKDLAEIDRLGIDVERTREEPHRLGETADGVDRKLLDDGGLLGIGGRDEDAVASLRRRRAPWPAPL